MKIRKWLTQEEAKILGLKIRKNEKGRNKARYTIPLEKYRELRQFVTTQKIKNKDGAVTSSIEKLQQSPIQIPEGHEIVRLSTNHTTGQQWIITQPKKSEDQIDYEKIIKKVINKCQKPVKVEIEPQKTQSKTFDRLIYTDTHIGMDTNGSKNAMYAMKWDKKALMRTLDRMIKEIITHKTGDILIIDDLGDVVDGWEGKTVRRQHDLPQNMNNQEMFETALEFKIKMIDNLVDIYPEIICHNIVNDNHAGDFAYILNSAFKQIIQLKYSKVKVNNFGQFINHYIIGHHAFVLSHGKYSHALKFGFKPFLDTKQIEKIDRYLKEYNVYKKAKYIEFSKGDSHQMLFDYCTSDDFDYCNYPSLAPSSEWVQTNYKKGRRGFVIQNVKYKEYNKTVLPIVL